jgi:GNAT superfamily N-acetyltransferase
MTTCCPGPSTAVADPIRVVGPLSHASEHCERVLRSLPRWFGIESALREYAAAAERLPTFGAVVDDALTGFVSLEAHLAGEWEVHCMAVHAQWRGKGVGAALLAAAEAWIRPQGAASIVVKTRVDSHASPQQVTSRAFYGRQGFIPEKIFPDLWGPSVPCLQMRKALGRD